MRMNEYGIDTESIKVGDRVLVTGCGEYFNDQNWGTVIEIFEDHLVEIFLDMDDFLLPEASKYCTSTGTACYLAYPSEVHGHTPAKPPVIDMDGFMEDFNALSPEEQKTLRELIRKGPKL